MHRAVLLLCLTTVLGACTPAAAPTTPPKPASGATAPTAPVSPQPSPAAKPTAPVPSPSPSPSPSPVAQRGRGQVIGEANAAYARRDYSTALRLYRQAASDDSLTDGRSAPSTPDSGTDLRAFARFRIVVADAVVGQEDDARATLDVMRRQDATTPYLGLAMEFWETYGLTADPKSACARITQSVREAPGRFLEPLSGIDAGGPIAAPDDVCQVP